MLKPKLYFEALVVIAVLALLIIFSTPKFIESQKKRNIETMIEDLRELRDFFVENPEQLKNNKIQKRMFSNSSQQIENEKYKAEVYKHFTELINLNSFEFIDFDEDNLTVIVHHYYTEQNSLNNTFQKNVHPPLFISVEGKINLPFNLDDMFNNQKQYKVGINSDGTYYINGGNNTFDISNGLESSGSIFFDTLDVWPPQKVSTNIY